MIHTDALVFFNESNYVNGIHESFIKEFPCIMYIFDHASFVSSIFIISLLYLEVLK